MTKRKPYNERQGPFLKNCLVCDKALGEPLKYARKHQFCSSYCSHKHWRENNKEKIRLHQIKRQPIRWHKDSLKKYGLNKKLYETIFSSQNNCCAICRISGSRPFMGVDHDHKTGKVRGILCRHCNLGISQLKENIFILKKAIDYLKGNK